MNREIKFRAWNGSEMITKSLQKEYDDYYMLNLEGEFFAHTRTGDEYFMPYDSEINHKVYELMQLTGIKDKNGVEIYEGDVVKCFLNGKKIGALDTIEFKDGAFILRSRTVTLHEWNTMPNGAYTGELEVLGNIYQHAELLK